MNHSSIEVQPETPAHPPQSTFNTDEASAQACVPSAPRTIPRSKRPQPQRPN